ncbi:MAG: transcriptional regulator [Thaumarchaeota archaeon]|nr:MAG: transcriptional regulator [Nitrososphaerota archaeon]
MGILDVYIMKKIEAMVPSLRRKDIVDSILNAGAQGVTVVESKGKGKGNRPLVSGARGTAKYIADYNRIDTITTVVDDSKIDSIVSIIMNTSYRGNNGDGMIFVSTIDEAYHIGTKSKISSLD